MQCDKFRCVLIIFDVVVVVVAAATVRGGNNLHLHRSTTECTDKRWRDLLQRIY